MNPNLKFLHPYPFEKLNRLKADLIPPAHLSPINLSIGEPQHPTPDFIAQALTQALIGLGKYPVTKGSDILRKNIANWLIHRFQLPAESIDPNLHILPVNGTREALFAIAQTVVNTELKNPLVLMPNPFYQIYEGAALLAGAKPYYLNALSHTQFQPNFKAVPNAIWAQCQLLYICSPANPSGTVLDAETLAYLIELADEYDFVIASDECYSELYDNEPPLGLLQVCAQLGRFDFKRCLVFHSLSKRSNAPGLRSGFVAGDAAILRDFLLYRTYHGCAMSPTVQAASAVAWADETHVQANRVAYQAKFDAVLAILQPILPILPMSKPPAGFYLWPQVPVEDTEFARKLFETQNITVLPGSFLSRTTEDGINPGEKRIRLALVASLAECEMAAQRIYEMMLRYYS